MSLAIEGIQSGLSYYTGRESHSGIVHEFLRLITELRQSNAYEKKLAAAISKLPFGDFFRRKLSDISLISGTYDALCSRSFLDEETLLDKLCEHLPSSHMFKDDLIVLNAFHGLTGQEMKVFKHMLRQAGDVVFLLCTDFSDLSDDPADAFAHTKNTAHELRRLAMQIRVPCKINSLPLTINNAAPALRHLEQNLFYRSAVLYEKPASEITIHASQSLKEECAWVALNIKKLVREQGLRCNEIAVIARDSTPYEAPLRTALRSCGLPLYQDSRQPIAIQPLLLIIRAALDICENGLRTTSIMQFLKTNLTALNIEEVSLLENYTFIWRIDGAAWAKPFTLHPDGLTNRPNDNAAERLDMLENLRQQVIIPLITIRSKMKEPRNGEDLSHAIWELLEDCGTANALRKVVAELRVQGEEVLAEEQAQVWDSLVELLDRFALLIEYPAPVSRLRELFSLMLEAESIGTIPQGLDEPAIGSANRMRFCQSPKAVFVLGCNAGVFPLDDSGTGLLTAAEREILQKLELPLSPCGEARQAQERFFVYHALSAARERLYLTYRTQSTDGSELLPSDFISEIRTMFPQGLGKDDDEYLFAESPEFAFSELAKKRRNPDDMSAAIHVVLSEKKDWSGKLAALDRAAIRKPFALTEQNAKSLFGKDLRFSASKAENYARCPFSYFCEYGVKAKPRRQIKIDPLSRGNLLHYVLEKLFKDIGKERLLELDKQDCLSVVQDSIESYRNVNLDGLEHTMRLAALLERNAHTLCEVLWRLLEELRQSEFTPVGFEVTLGGDGLPAYELNLPVGGKISFTGKIDRVDEAIIGGEKYLRVVDYKSGSKKLLMEDVLGGLQVQLLIYLFALQKANPDSKPAAALYQPLTVKSKGGRGEEEISTMPSGLFLEDLTILQAMERDLAKKYIPVGMTAKGDLSKTGTMKELIKTLEGFAELKQQVDALLMDFGEQITAGAIPALPARDESSCAYCEYHAVCLHENDDAYRDLKAIQAI